MKDAQSREEEAAAEGIAEDTLATDVEGTLDASFKKPDSAR